MGYKYPPNRIPEASIIEEAEDEDTVAVVYFDKSHRLYRFRLRRLRSQPPNLRITPYPIQGNSRK